MIKLYSFGTNFGVDDPSPFVLKVITYMRMANIEFETIADLDNLKQAPKGKLPFIRDGETVISDSQFIIAYLQEKFQVNLDEHLSKEQKGAAYLMGKSLDENLYWCLVYARWVKEDTWPHVKKAFFGEMPFPLKFIIPSIVRMGIISALKKQGIGRHSDQEIKQITNQSFQALSDVLGDNAYFFGDSPSTFDATAFAFLSEYIDVTLKNEFNELACQHSNLVKYCKKINANYF